VDSGDNIQESREIEWTFQACGNCATDADRVRAEGRRRDRRLHRRQDADRLRIERRRARCSSDRRVEPTVIRYIASVLTVALNIILVVAILGYFGVETTSFAALVAGLGIRRRRGWGGSCRISRRGCSFSCCARSRSTITFSRRSRGHGANDRPLQHDDRHPDNVQTFVGNGKIMGGTIKNFSNNPYRRVELTAQLDHTVDPADAVRRAQGRAAADCERRDPIPKPDVEIITFNERGPGLAVRPYCNTAHYWQVYFDTNRTIRETFGAAVTPAAEAASPLPAEGRVSRPLVDARLIPRHSKEVTHGSARRFASVARSAA
jgi:small conductance mechanosensitive channel